MKRRQFMSLLGGTAAWPIAARAQQTPTVGYVFAGSPEESTHLTAAFRKGLTETGYVEGKNVAIEYRWTHNQNDQLPALVADLVRHRVTVIVTPNFVRAALEAKAATSSIPIVFGGGFDPVQAGLVASLNRPGGNITGVSFMGVELGAKRLGLLHELLPGAARFAVLVNPTNPNAQKHQNGGGPAYRARLSPLVRPEATHRRRTTPFPIEAPHLGGPCKLNAIIFNSRDRGTVLCGPIFG